MRIVIIKIGNWLFNAIKEGKEPKYSNSLGDAVRDGISLPSNPTNGDMIKAMFPNQNSDNVDSVALLDIDGYVITTFHKKWWNAPYERSTDANNS